MFIYPIPHIPCEGLFLFIGDKKGFSVCGCKTEDFRVHLQSFKKRFPTGFSELSSPVKHGVWKESKLQVSPRAPWKLWNVSTDFCVKDATT